jgi:hypothetical protein
MCLPKSSCVRNLIPNFMCPWYLEVWPLESNYNSVFLQYWGLSSGPHTCWAGALPPLALFCISIFKIGSLELFAQPGFIHSSPGLCLLSSWDSRHLVVIRIQSGYGVG